MKYALLVLALAACNPYLTQQSVAPPGRTARLDPVNGFWGLKRYRLELSEGVALAVTCNQGAPCEHTNVISDDPAIAEVRPASLAALEPVGLDSTAPSSAFVVVGKAPGTTRLHVKTKDGKRDVVVTVIAPPGPPNLQTAAASHP
ncbi:MAG TPA: hypothetical protein VIV40_04265 [Kofleriaceae bacterium]